MLNSPDCGGLVVVSTPEDHSSECAMTTRKSPMGETFRMIGEWSQNMCF